MRSIRAARRSPLALIALAAIAALGSSACSEKTVSPAAPEAPGLSGECWYDLAVRFEDAVTLAEAEAFVQSLAAEIGVEYRWASQGYRSFRGAAAEGAQDEVVDALEASPLIDHAWAQLPPSIVARTVAGVSEPDVQALVAGIPDLQLQEVTYWAITAVLDVEDGELRERWIATLSDEAIVAQAYHYITACP